MNNDLDALVKATHETHPPTQPVTNGADSLTVAATRLRDEHDLDRPRVDSTPNIVHSPNYPRRRAIFAIGAVAAGIFAWGAVEVGKEVFGNEYMLGADANFSPDNQSWRAGQGQGLEDAAQAVRQDGGGVDLRIIQEEIEARNTEALADGLQAGEQLQVPVSVEPKE